MAAGQGFKTFTTGEVLTAADTNGYLMQGVLVFADAAARSAAITSPQEGQTSYLKDTDEIQVYSGSTWVTKSGGLPSQTGNSGKYLTTDGTNASWGTVSGGGRTLISTTSLTGASVTLSSIPQTYKSLFLEIYGVTNATANDSFVLDPNNAGGVIYTAMRRGVTTTNSGAGELVLTSTNTTDRTNANNVWSVSFDNYTSTTNYKSINFYGVFFDSGGANCSIVGGGGFISNTAITSINIRNFGGNLSTGTVKLYGVN